MARTARPDTRARALTPRPHGAAGGFVRRRVPARAKPYLRFALARGKALLGRDHFPGRAGLDQRLLAHLGGLRGGVFIEAGAYDGLDQSNTWHLEQQLGWRGLLVEPIPAMAALCRRFRRSPVERCALGSFALEGTALALHFGGLMTTADDALPRRMLGGSAARHAAQGAAGIARDSYRFEAPVVALSTLIDRHALGSVDLLSLDVEGQEESALRGIDFDRHRIDHILIETVDPTMVAALLGPRYAVVARLANHDYLFRHRDAATPDA